MNSIKALLTTILISVTTLLLGCAHQDVDQQVEEELVREHSTCFARRLPANSAAHTDCVLLLYQERQRQRERLRNVVAPPPAEDAKELTLPPASRSDG